MIVDYTSSRVVLLNIVLPSIEEAKNPSIQCPVCDKAIKVRDCAVDGTFKSWEAFMCVCSHCFFSFYIKLGWDLTKSKNEVNRVVK